MLFEFIKIAIKEISITEEHLKILAYYKEIDISNETIVLVHKVKKGYEVAKDVVSILIFWEIMNIHCDNPEYTVKVRVI